jgi:hypothetical protein
MLRPYRFTSVLFINRTLRGSDQLFMWIPYPISPRTMA